MDLLSFSVCTNECETTINFSERISPLYLKQERLIFWIRYVYLPKNSKLLLIHLGREVETLDDENDDVTVTVCHCLFLINIASNQKLMTTSQKPLYHFPRKVARRSLILVSTVLMSPFCGNGLFRGNYPPSYLASQTVTYFKVKLGITCVNL